MRKLTISLLCAVFLLCAACSITASAADGSYGSITITYSDGTNVFSGVPIYAYRIANTQGNGNFTLTGAFNSYPIRVSNIKSQQEWRNLATTITGYIQADELQPDGMVITNNDGVVKMTYMTPGLYLVLGVTLQDGYTVHNFEPFFAYMPKYENGIWDYDVEFEPKYSTYTPQTEYSVVKLWEDAGHSDKRPQQIEVEIYKDDTLWSTETLNSANNWKYAWQADADDTRWSIVEKTVPEGYEVTISENSGVFSIINSYNDIEEPSDDPEDDPEDDSEDPPTDTPTPPPTQTIMPSTGDTYSIYLYASILCVSGILLIILAIYRNRKNNEET